MKMAVQKEHFKRRTKDIQLELKDRSERIKESKEMEKKRREFAQYKMEEKKKELMRQQVEKRKYYEQNKASKAREVIEENRRRAQLEQELPYRGQEQDRNYQRMRDLSNVNTSVGASDYPYNYS